VKAIHLGFKAFDLHELACHVVAECAGVYSEYGLDVSLMDTKAVPDRELPDSLFSAACGSAVIRWLHGEKLKVVFVAAKRPMFWLYSQHDAGGLDGLRGQCVATYPDAAPPAQFLRIVLEDAGLTADRDVHLEPGRDDVARLEMLRSGHAAAALVSSATLPCRVEEFGFRQLLCVGDCLRLPTTGLAVSLGMFEREPEAVAAMVESHRTALRLIHDDQPPLRRGLREAGLVDERDLDSACELLRQFFTTDGLVRAADVLPGVRRLAVSLKMAIPVENVELYDCIRRY